MKTKLQKLLIAIAGLLFSANAFALNKFYVDEIYYNITSSKNRTVEVTYKDALGDNYNYKKQYEGDISIPPKVIYGNITYTVTGIGEYAFYNCSGMTSVSIPNSVTSIDRYAFFNCDGMTSVSIPNSVTSIGRYAFLSCNITSVSIPNSVTSIGNYAFCNCSRMTSVSIPNSVTSISIGAFNGCTGLTEVNISDLSSWCNIDFSDMDSNPLYYAGTLKLNGVEINDLVIPNDITEITEYAFSGCTGLTSVTIPNSVTTII